MTADLSKLCQSCGACCATSADWPRFSLESDEALALIPAALIDDSQGKMRCAGDRCAALSGKVGVATACSIYALRPDVCRECQPGDPECNIARARYGFAAVILRGSGFTLAPQDDDQAP